MKSEIEFPKIDFYYWSNKNEAFSDSELTSTIRTGLLHARRGNLIGPILDSINLKTNKMLVDLISQKIQAYNNISKFSDDELLIIFDLIQGWGGRMGKTPYVKPQTGPTRLTWKPLAKTYRDSIAISFDNNFNYEHFLNCLMQIPGIGVSFATKHMFFWTEYGPRRNAIPIYDARIKLLLCLSERDAVDYKVFYMAMEKAAQVSNITVAIIERALFAFSQNYFPNNSLVINSTPKDMTDIDEALRLERQYSEYNSLVSSQDKIASK